MLQTFYWERYFSVFPHKVIMRGIQFIYLYLKCLKNFINQRKICNIKSYTKSDYVQALDGKFKLVIGTDVLFFLTARIKVKQLPYLWIMSPAEKSKVRCSSDILVRVWWTIWQNGVKFFFNVMLCSSRSCTFGGILYLNFIIQIMFWIKVRNLFYTRWPGKLVSLTHLSIFKYVQWVRQCLTVVNSFIWNNKIDVFLSFYPYKNCYLSIFSHCSNFSWNFTNI